MVADSADHYHHDNHQPMDLAALRADINQTFATFRTFLDTLTPLPMKTAPVQPPMAPMSVSTDGDDVPCTIGCRPPMADANNATPKHPTQCQPMDLLALQ